MAGSMRISLNLRGLNALMRSPEMQKVVDDKGRRMAAEAGENFEYVAKPHKWTARGYVQPRNAAGMREEAVEKRLTRTVRRD